jgi:hypothetical protein
MQGGRVTNLSARQRAPTLRLSRRVGRSSSSACAVTLLFPFGVSTKTSTVPNEDLGSFALPGRLVEDLRRVAGESRRTSSPRLCS